jgi:hypothetical protein
MRLPTCPALIGVAFFQSQVCKMPLVVRPADHADVAQCVSIRVASLGSLVIGHPPPYPGYVEKQEASFHNDLDNSPHVHHLKVVDTENEEEVVAYAKLEVYKHGRPDLEKLRESIKKSDKEVDQFGLLREAAHDYFSRRNSDMGKHPHIRESIMFLLSGRKSKAHNKIFKLTSSISQSWPFLSQLVSTDDVALVAFSSDGELRCRMRLVFHAIYRLLNKGGACISTTDFKISARLNLISRIMD